MVLARFSSGALTPVVALVTVVSVVTVVRTVRFPGGLYERLRETPRGRSLNAEIVARLEASFGPQEKYVTQDELLRRGGATPPTQPAFDLKPGKPDPRR